MAGISPLNPNAGARMTPLHPEMSADRKGEGRERNLEGLDPHSVWDGSTPVRCGESAFSVAAPRVWNQLPTDLKRCRSTALFRRKLKASLFTAPCGLRSVMGPWFDCFLVCIVCFPTCPLKRTCSRDTSASNALYKFTRLLAIIIIIQFLLFCKCYSRCRFQPYDCVVIIWTEQIQSAFNFLGTCWQCGSWFVPSTITGRW